MAEPSLLDPSALDAFPQLDPFFSSFHRDQSLPDDPSLPPLDAGDLDLDLFVDLDFPIESLLADPPPPDFCSSHSAGHSASAAGPASPDSANSTSYPNPNPHPDSPDSAVSFVGAKPESPPLPPGVKRKSNESSDPTPNPNPNPKLAKVRRRSDGENSSCTFAAGGDDDDKRKARLMRNRESAQLSRQRKKHHVEDLEEKIRSLHTTIADLNGKMSYIVAENASLRQRLTGAPVPLPGVYPAMPPGPMRPPPHFPWVPGYAYRPKAGVVPIPRLKPQQPAPAPKTRKRTKKVASVSLLCMLFVMLLFGGLFPVLHPGSSFGEYGVAKGGILGHLQGRVLAVSGGRSGGANCTDEIGMRSGEVGRGDHIPASTRNSSETLPALLYVPRNGKHVKINGNLIIHSVLASEKAAAEKASMDEAKKLAGDVGKGTGFAIASDLVPALAVPQPGDGHSKQYMSSDEHHRDVYGDSSKSSPADGPLQQWFREGLAGPILSSGLCTEVFQFEVSPASNPGGIVPASAVNATEKFSNKTARRGKMRNRRTLYPHPIPLPGTTMNDPEHSGKHSDSSNFHRNASVPSMVVSVLADPREAGDGDSDGMMSTKSLSRIFVVVLQDSIKYITYSCALPFKTSSPHLL